MLESLSRYNGTTAGGTTLKLNVSGISEALAQNLTVTLGGIPCALHYDDITSYRDQHLCDWDGVDCSNIGVEYIRTTNTTMLTCLTNPWDYSGDAREAEIVVRLDPYGDARNPHNLVWAYVDLWSALTTWGGKEENVGGQS